MQLTWPTLSDFREVVNKISKRGLFQTSVEPPDGMCLTEFQWLHELETRPYTPPWIHKTRPRVGAHTILEPTITLKIAESVPDSCPASPLIVHEVSDSECEI